MSRLLIDSWTFIQIRYHLLEGIEKTDKARTVLWYAQCIPLIEVAVIGFLLVRQLQTGHAVKGAISL